MKKISTNELPFFASSIVRENNISLLLGGDILDALDYVRPDIYIERKEIGLSVERCFYGTI